MVLCGFDFHWSLAPHFSEPAPQMQLKDFASHQRVTEPWQIFG
jgi:hypothetical protein